MVSSVLPPPSAAPLLKTRQDAAWESFFVRLLEFKRQHGHYHVPKDAEHASLFYWTGHQRSHLKTGRLRAERRERLLAAGFPGEPNFNQRQADDRIWDRHFVELMAFRRQQGHFQIPYKNANYKLLREWVNHMRRKKASGKLKPDRAQRLEAAGFLWSGMTRKFWLGAPRKPAAKLKEINNARWERRFAELRAFHLAHGHFHVPDGIYGVGGSFALKGWFMQQRHLRQRGRLLLEQEQRLKALGFPWEPEWPQASAHVGLAKKIPGAETFGAGTARL